MWKLRPEGVPFISSMPVCGDTGRVSVQIFCMEIYKVLGGELTPMYKRTTTIINETGLHARPASDFTRAASAFASEIMICRLDNDSRLVNAKSTVLLLTLGLDKGSEVELSAEGSDEKAAVDALVGLIESGFV